ncbi:DUF3298 and DUF4163 domain-containing protein [Natronincola ferrireducens]|uniref:DUF3298 domain-containing protein n=1 Tax=Natronincola ferrireducens TaxID=393762 RepID=A0A1G9DWL5_9FIRM|nr:DUF3298 and DUF4163 domain-containing protein [Natronincola ferrireducens]SDK68248.1 protein of unknown function [Natronincola ferrireducens]
MNREVLGARIIQKKLIRYRIGLTYPEITDLENKEAEDTINQLIQEEIYRMIVEQGYEEDYTIEIWGDYEVKVNDKDLLSILLNIHSYSKGAAHGLKAVKALNIDLKRGKLYELKDLFLQNNNYIDKINEIVKEEIVTKDIPLLVEFETIDKRQDFYLTKEGITIFFQIYEYTPYAYGIPEFKISYDILTEMIDIKSPINAFLKE